jgi:hypothetical protein
MMPGAFPEGAELDAARLLPIREISGKSRRAKMR